MRDRRRTVPAVRQTELHGADDEPVGQVSLDDGLLSLSELSADARDLSLSLCGVQPSRAIPQRPFATEWRIPRTVVMGQNSRARRVPRQSQAVA